MCVQSCNWTICICTCDKCTMCLRHVYIIRTCHHEITVTEHHILRHVCTHHYIMCDNVLRCVHTCDNVLCATIL